MNNNTFLITYTLLLFIALLGSIFNDYYNTLSGKESKMVAGRILIGAITGFLFTILLMDYLPEGKGITSFNIPKFAIALSFVAGIGGFQLFPLLQMLKLSRILELLTNIKIEKKDGEE